MIAAVQPVTWTKRNIAGIAIVYVFLLYAMWIAAWLLERLLERLYGINTSETVIFVYWLIMKLLLWTLPSVYLMHLSGRKFSDVIGLKNIYSAIIWGGGAGLILGIIAVITRLTSHQPLFSFAINWSFISAVIIAPIIEEITFRGAVMGALQTRFKFAMANLITGVLFLGAHLPGWYFQGNLMTNLFSLTGGAISILILGLVFGLVAYKSRSLAGSILTHMLNNLFNA